MKRLLLIVFLLSSTVALAEDSHGNDATNFQTIEKFLTHSQEHQQINCADTKFSLAGVDYKDQLERRGCCSWHGGVCGCSSGRAVCCDGKLSPSCGC